MHMFITLLKPRKTCFCLHLNLHCVYWPQQTVHFWFLEMAPSSCYTNCDDYQHALSLTKMCQLKTLLKIKKKRRRNHEMSFYPQCISSVWLASKHNCWWVCKCFSVPLRHSYVHRIHTQAQWRRWDRADSFHQVTWEQAASVCRTGDTKTLQLHSAYTDAAAAPTWTWRKPLSSMLSVCISLSLNIRQPFRTGVQTCFTIISAACGETHASTSHWLPTCFYCSRVL